MTFIIFSDHKNSDITLRGAAGGAVLMAELLCAEGYID